MLIHFLEFGKKGKPLIFLHGWQQNGRSFLPLVNFLYKDYRLFFLDLPGFGQSGIPPANFSSFDYAKQIQGWIKKRKLKKVILIGHSFGGKIGLIIASQKPQLIEKLILISNAGISHPKKYIPSAETILNKLLKKIPLKLKSLFASKDYKQAGSLLPVFKTVVKEDIRYLLPNITVSTLIVWGKNDKELPLEDGKIMRKYIPNSKLAVVNGGHFPFWENPEKISVLIKKFIRNEH